MSQEPKAIIRIRARISAGASDEELGHQMAKLWEDVKAKARELRAKDVPQEGQIERDYSEQGD